MSEESKNTYDESSVKALLEWVQTVKLPKELELSDAEYVFDTSMYLQSNISDIKAHYPDPFYNAAIDRLNKLKAKVEADNL